ncbi:MULTISPECIES: YqgE/AlgH family protein [Rhodobacterales]|jgi:putative transcriptional regulator|uniref:YqgE/AlgH family protein n=1 Tax=Rhodobacterales TaxID=204455 RepID=UPI00237F49E3|nr:YqgE/AlgH family protein [Phaeobacter gallaeciensis]MDE4140276.1 YqgE/AlgH family protein [Phaeobacter gallaeciensis]MDE4149031.1 YqgE/AlgH family protein [Phaeobacter gallaeciensis]MDE4153253.1 YqgE/AlgH family protein [Phaeobacter gallaeciensis]MDE4190418.1 YqgE/AlgH family protein [Phaeobacter gallaeciensis]MDE4198089.1 YqgE/AlgH family protein [Phaeobacter gallaeciensis]
MDLTGKLLIAMPGIGDPRFEHAVVFLCSHSDEGAMGLIVNKTAPGVQLGSLLEQLEIEANTDVASLPVRFGGPVETQRGFVLHSDDYHSRVNSLDVPGGFAMTATLDILEDIAEGSGPEKMVVMLGYAGWGPGQLESEIVANGWLTAEASAELLFEMDDLEKWGAALKTLGVDPVSLSSSAGTA